MCQHCSHPTRRQLLAFGGAAALAALTAPALAATVLAPDEALQRLRDGNSRFVTAPELCALDMQARRSEISTQQAPWATVLGCADSRTTPELLFGGLNLGELFVCRNAGNTADPATMGTIEYGAAHLGSPLIVVLAHQRCGAVSAACQVARTGAVLEGSMGPMVDDIVAVARGIAGEGTELIERVARESAVQTAMRIAQSPIVAERIAAGTVKVVAAHYDLDSGQVEFLD